MSSVVARLGGEEFLVAELTESDAPAMLAERLREAVAAMPYGVTASVGVAAMPVDDIEWAAAAATITQLGEAADAAMYEAKRAGGNRVRYRAATSPRA
jgi:diguanylate cyclase (GGDEF)-like protein